MRRFLYTFLYTFPGCLLPVLIQAAGLSPNTGNITLHSDLDMHVEVTQQGGACQPGYRWHTTHGGCRQASIEYAQESQPCGTGYTGDQTRTRTRTRHELQATHQAAFDPWQTWQAWDRSACTAVRRTPKVPNPLITAITGGEMSYEYRKPTPQATPMRFVWRNRKHHSHSSSYGITLDKARAQLRCAFAAASTTSSGENGYPTFGSWLLGAGESFKTKHGYCTLTQDNLEARLMGNCHATTGGDIDSCIPGTATVSIVAIENCSVTVRINVDEGRRRNSDTSESAYPICE